MLQSRCPLGFDTTSCWLAGVLFRSGRSGRFAPARPRERCVLVLMAVCKCAIFSPNLWKLSWRKKQNDLIMAVRRPHCSHGLKLGQEWWLWRRLGWLEFLLIGTKSNHTNGSDFSILIADTSVSSSPQVKSLAVVLDNILSFQSLFNNITLSAYFHLRNFARLHLSPNSTAILVHSQVTFRLHYCNSLLSAKSICKLQPVHHLQNPFRQSYNSCLAATSLAPH